MNAVDTDLNIDSTSPAERRASRRGWLGVGVAAAGIVVVTAGLALVPRGPEPSRVIVEPMPPTSTPAALPPVAEEPKELTDATRLQLDRIGSVRIGMTLEEASAASGTPITIKPRSDLGHGCAHAAAEGGPEGLQFMVVNGRIARIEAWRGPVATVEGITTGSPVQDVLAAYPGRIRVEPHTYTARRGGQYLIHEPEGANGLSMLFETDGSRVTTFRSGLTGAVMAPEGCA